MKPQFANLQDFLNMGGHSGYVFSAFGISIALIIGLTIMGFVNAQKANYRLKSLEELRQKDAKK